MKNGTANKFEEVYPWNSNSSMLFNPMFSGISCDRIQLNSHSRIQTGNLTTCSDEVNAICMYQQSVHVVCEDGYMISDGQNGATMMCQVNKTYNIQPPICSSMFTFLFLLVVSCCFWLRAIAQIYVA